MSVNSEAEFANLCPGLDDEHALWHLQEAEGDPVLAAHQHMEGECGPFASHDEDNALSFTAGAAQRRRRVDERLAQQLNREMTAAAAGQTTGHEDAFSEAARLVRAATFGDGSMMQRRTSADGTDMGLMMRSGTAGNAGSMARMGSGGALGADNGAAAAAAVDGMPALSRKATRILSKIRSRSFGAAAALGDVAKGSDDDDDDEDPEDNVPFSARLPGLIKKLAAEIQQQRNAAAAPVKTRKKSAPAAKGKKALPKKKAAAAGGNKSAAKKKKGGDSDDDVDEDEDEDVDGSDEDENEHSDDVFAYLKPGEDEDDVPFDELLRRKANAEAAEQEAAEEDDDDNSSASDYDYESASGDSDDSDEDDADAAGGKKAAAAKAGGKKKGGGKAAAAPVTRELQQFMDMVQIPFRTAEEDKAVYERTNNNAIAPTAAVLAKHVQQCHSARQQYALPGYTDLRSAPFFMTGSETLDPQQVPQLINHIVAQPDMECKCLWIAASAGTPQPLRRMIASSAFRNGVLRVIAPVNPQQAQLKEIKLDDGSVRYEPTFYYNKTREAFFRNNFTHVWPCPEEFKHTLHWCTQPAARWRWHRPPPRNYFRFLNDTAFKDKPITEQDNWKELIPSDHRDDPSLRFGAADSRQAMTVIYMPPPGIDNDPEHALHHLFIRMRAIQNKQQNNNASLGFDVLGASREQVWARRLAVQCVVAAFMPNMPREPLLANIATAFHSTPTGEQFYADAVELSNMTSKDFFERFGAYFVRIKTDISTVPLQPPGFLVSLYEHQRRSVAFMLERERHGVKQFLSSEPYRTPNGEMIRFHVNMALGAIVATKCGSKEEAEIAGNGTHRGGILADATGAGKTLSILALITLNGDNRPAHVVTGTTLRASMPERDGGAPLEPEEQRFKDSLDKKLRVKATLLIAPVSLIVQWGEEINQKAPHLKWMMLHGAAKRDKVTYAEIAAADIVLVTYETYRAIIREEQYWFKWFGAIRQESGQFLRTGQRIFALPQNAVPGQRDYTTRKAAALFRSELKRKKLRTERPPPTSLILSRVMFRRIVLDEFHRAGGLTKDMQLVDSDFVWLVSGTPLDADFGQIARRMGICDFSFVDDARLAFSINTVESKYPARVDGEFFENIFTEKPLYMRNNVQFEHDARPAPNPKASVTYAKAAILSQLMIRNTVQQCQALANITITQEVVHVQHKKAEREKYLENLEVVRVRFLALEARGRVHTRMLDVLSLLNDLRRAAIDPFSVTLRARDALAVGSGQGFQNECARRSIVLVPASIVSHKLWPRDFPSPSADEKVPAGTDIRHIEKMPLTENLKESLQMLQQKPPQLPPCGVCMDSIMQPCVLTCSHMFCYECVISVAQTQTDGKCPTCRKPTMEDKIKKTLLTFPIPDEEEKEVQTLLRREKTLDDMHGDAAVLIKRESTTFGAELLADDGNQPKVPTKIAKVIEIIEEALLDDATSKFLIFTSFPSVLGSLRKLLCDASIGCVVIDASSSLQQRGQRVQMFQDPTNFSVRACIVSSRVGNAGITLTQANNLIIVEPQNNLDTDLQIIGRVLRLSQTRSVRVHRLIMDGTLEPVLHEAVQLKTLSLSGGGTEIARKRSIDMVKSMLWPEGAPGNAAAAAGAAVNAAGAFGAAPAVAAPALDFLQPGAMMGGLAADRGAFVADEDMAAQLAAIAEWEKQHGVGQFAHAKMVEDEDEEHDDDNEDDE